MDYLPKEFRLYRVGENIERSVKEIKRREKGITVKVPLSLENI